MHEFLEGQVIMSWKIEFNIHIQLFLSTFLGSLEFSLIQLVCNIRINLNFDLIA